MKYFYCQSYLSFNFALKFNEICIITSQKNIIRACEYLGIKYINHKAYSVNDFFLKRKKVKNEIKEIISVIDSGQFHFSHSQYAIFCFLLAHYMQKKNKILFYHNFEYKYSKVNFYFSIEFIKFRIIQYLLGIFYAPIFELRCLLKNKFVISINEKRIGKAKIKRYDLGQYNKIVEEVMMNFKISKENLKGILFIDQGITNENYFNVKESYELLTYLKLKTTIIKEHPIHTKKDFFNGFKLLPSFLPVEMFFNTMKGIVVSPYSNALITASKFPDITSIALLYLIKDNKAKEEIKEKYNKESNGKIIFVNSLKELLTFVEKNE